MSIQLERSSVFKDTKYLYWSEFFVFLFSSFKFLDRLTRDNKEHIYDFWFAGHKNSVNKYNHNLYLRYSFSGKFLEFAKNN
jgi:hypothetical protein